MEMKAATTVAPLFHFLAVARCETGGPLNRGLPTDLLAITVYENANYALFDNGCIP